MRSIIRPGATVYLDTNAIIHLTEGNPDFKASIEWLFVEIERVGARLVTSELTSTEVLAPFRAGNDELVAAYERLLETLIEPIPLGRRELFMAAKLRANTPTLRTPDALHLATAIHHAINTLKKLYTRQRLHAPVKAEGMATANLARLGYDQAIGKVGAAAFEVAKSILHGSWSFRRSGCLYRSLVPRHFAALSRPPLPCCAVAA